MKTEIVINTIFAVLFFTLFVFAVVGIIIGKWWHVSTAAIAYFMFKLSCKEIKQCQDED